MEALSTRAIGRAAVRDELARIALPRFFEDGFESVTFDDLAAAAGVSRSTFLRHFGSKEDVVLYVFDPLGDAISGVLASRPTDEDEWVSLRRAVDPVVELLTRDPGAGLALISLVWKTPALWSRLHEKQGSWRPAIADLLAERAGADAAPILVLRTRAMAALGCLMVAFDSWVMGEGSDDLAALTDTTFGSLAPADSTT
ncbi:TetR/AcrR family transcriptional regulator [Glaciihabitans sp. dw_435]|uniref:TetR/AcrR family transcriptional regulator n=1 Tax=Glaciihabitans sp. dw_435 TaxID=2720081 RepID=UPI001BD5ABE1|nr:TetR/AcrR family transcriptional regulator [Glaciihabitans sp. dw_435]